jgi:hypothetical protein
MSKPLRPGDPDHLGDYELVSRLGTGGMGTVYLGRARDGRRVAIKVIRSELSWDEEHRGRFRSEVNRIRQVPPFSTAAILDADPDHDPPYLVVEYVDGPSLADVVRDNGPLSPAELHPLAIGISTALVAIHGAGVIHRDLKPGNVLFALGGVKVIDFGIARTLEATSQHTRTDQMVGTVAYMAPERFETDAHRVVGTAADVFAWGVVMTYAATGHTPFGADSAPATAMRILTQPPDLGGVTGPLRDLVNAALAKDPIERPTARQLLDSLLYGTGATAPAAHVSSPGRPLAYSPGLPPGSAPGRALGSLPRRTMGGSPGRPRKRGGRVALVAAAIVAGLAVAAAVPWVLLSSEADDAAGRTGPAAGAAANPTDGAVVDEQLGGGAGVTAPPSPAAPSSPAAKRTKATARKKTTPGAMVALIARLLPDRELSHLRHLGDDLHVQLYLDSGDGPGMMAVSIVDSDRKPAKESGAGPEIAVERQDGNCVQTVIASALWPDGTLVQAEVATCLAWDGTQNKPANAPLTMPEAADLVTDPRWGFTTDPALIDAGKQYADQLR